MPSKKQKKTSPSKLNLLQKWLPVLVVGLAVVVGTTIIFSGRNNQTDNRGVVTCIGNDSGHFKCWEERYKQMVAKQSVQAAFADLKENYKTNGLLQSQCHPFAHRIGRAAAEKYQTVSEAYKYGDDFCWSGYYHGVMETVSHNLGKERVIATMNDICAGIRAQQKQSFYHYNCVHGLGHGVMGLTHNELFESLPICDKLQDDWERQSCYGGVFMENVMIGEEPAHTSKYLKSDQPMYPCTAVDASYKNQCYLMQSSYALKQNSYNFADVFQQCSVIDTEFVATCYQSVGRDASGTTSSDIARTVANCNFGATQDARDNCAVGAVKDFISYFHSDTQAKQLCDAFQEESSKLICHQTAVEYYSIF